jgi:hypothetical protein
MVFPALGTLTTGLSIGIVGIRDALFINGALAVLAQVLIGRVWFRQAAITNP